MVNKLFQKINQNFNEKGIIFLLLFIIILILVFIIIMYASNNNYLRLQVEEKKYIESEIINNVLISDRDKYLKYTDFYSKVIGWYGKKPQSKKALNKYQKSDFIINCFRYEKWLDIDHFYFISIALMETYFNPNSKGVFGEKGIFQQQPGAVGQARIFLEQLKIAYPYIAKKLEFVYIEQKDLYDPINALKVQALLAWGYKRMFKNEKVWWVSAGHWGLSLIYPLWYRNKIPPERFVFNKGKVNEIARNPLSYYFVYNEIHNAFSHFRKDINIEEGYLKSYMKACSRIEMEFIQSWKYIQKLNSLSIEIDDINKELQKKVKKYDKLIKKADNEYRRIYGLAKKGKIKFKDLFRMTKLYFKGFIKKIEDKK